MIANPIVEQLILAGPTREVAMEMYALDEENGTLFVSGCPRGYKFGVIRVAPELTSATRFPAYVTWMPKAAER